MSPSRPSSASNVSSVNGATQIIRRGDLVLMGTILSSSTRFYYIQVCLGQIWRYVAMHHLLCTNPFSLPLRPPRYPALHLPSLAYRTMNRVSPPTIQPTRLIRTIRTNKLIPPLRVRQRSANIGPNLRRLRHVITPRLIVHQKLTIGRATSAIIRQEAREVQATVDG
jgi:hypothetical protein